MISRPTRTFLALFTALASSCATQATRENPAPEPSSVAMCRVGPLGDHHSLPVYFSGEPVPCDSITPENISDYAHIGRIRETESLDVSLIRYLAPVAINDLFSCLDASPAFDPLLPENQGTFVAIFDINRTNPSLHSIKMEPGSKTSAEGRGVVEFCNSRGIDRSKQQVRGNRYRVTGSLPLTQTMKIEGVDSSFKEEIRIGITAVPPPTCRTTKECVLHRSACNWISAVPKSAIVVKDRGPITADDKFLAEPRTELEVCPIQHESPSGKTEVSCIQNRCRVAYDGKFHAPDKTAFQKQLEGAIYTGGPNESIPIGVRSSAWRGSWKAREAYVKPRLVPSP
jgi:hypothetical protein